MLKRMGIFLLMLTLCLSALTGQAEITAKEYTDVPGMPTQDSVSLIQILHGYRCETQPAEEASMAILNQIFAFVYQEGHRPVRYYDVPTQEKIQALIPGVDPDILHMSEYMTVQITPEAGRASAADTYTFDMLINVDYQPGQLVVGVIGTDYADAEALAWHPYRCEVTETGRIVMHIPATDLLQYQNAPVLLHILTDRIGGRGSVLWTEEEIAMRIILPSKTEEELRRVVHYTTTEGASVADDFRLFLVPKTEAMEEEIQRMRLFLQTDAPLYRYFPETIQREMQLLFPAEVPFEQLLAYEIVAVRDENYHDTYGDVAALLSFAVKYSPEQGTAVLLGFPKTDAPEWEWTCMRAGAKDGGIETIFEQLMLIRLEKEPGLLILISEPIPTAEPKAAEGRID